MYESTSELFLCPVDEQEPDPYQQGTPARLVRLDETVQKPGDVLNYLYDFGDDWDLTITSPVSVPPRRRTAVDGALPRSSWR